MNYSENDNIYEFNAIDVLAEYGKFVEGTPECMVAVCFCGALSEKARDAIAASCGKLGVGECAWVDACAVAESAAAAEAASGAGAEAASGTEGASARGLFDLLEGLDPKAVVAVDSHAAEAVGEAYGCIIAPDASSRVFGRTCVAFRSFESMLAEPESKQRAWALLKQLL